MRRCVTCGREFRSFRGSGQGRACCRLCRFWSYVDVKGEDECWNWRGSVSGRGYGKFSDDWRMLATHRVVFEMFHGPVTTPMILHRCDNRRCVNPAHLWAGDAKANTRDMIDKGRAAWQKPGSKASRDELGRFEAG